MSLKGYWEEAVPRARKASGMEWPVPSAPLSKACSLFLGNNLGGPSCVPTVAAPGAASEVTAYSGSLCCPRGRPPVHNPLVTQALPSSWQCHLSPPTRSRGATCRLRSWGRGVCMPRPLTQAPGPDRRGYKRPTRVLWPSGRWDRGQEKGAVPPCLGRRTVSRSVFPRQRNPRGWREVLAPSCSQPHPPAHWPFPASSLVLSRKCCLGWGASGLWTRELSPDTKPASTLVLDGQPPHLQETTVCSL